MALAFSLLLLGLLCAAVLAIPVDLRVDAAADDEWNAKLRIAWLFGWLQRDISGTRPPVGETEGTWPKRAQLELLFRKSFRDLATRLFRHLRRWISIEEVHGRLRFGLSDPADTGMAIGLIYPLVDLARLQPQVDFEVDPHFGGAMLAGEVRGRLRTIPLGVLVALLRFILSAEALRTLRRWRSLRK